MDRHNCTQLAICLRIPTFYADELSNNNFHFYYRCFIHETPSIAASAQEEISYSKKVHIGEWKSREYIA